MTPPRTPTLALSVLGSALLLACSSGGGGGSNDPAPTADFSATPRAGTPPLMVQFMDLSSSGVTAWSWSFGDGGVASTQNPSHSYSAVGTYSVSLTVTDPAGMDSETKSGYVSVTATADVTPPVITCPGDQSVSGFDTDPFSGSSLDTGVWTRLNQGLLSSSVSSGELHMQPTAGGSSASWFDDDEGPAIVRSVTGDFTATATLRVEDPNNPGQPPQAQYRLAGLIARNPASSSGNRNSVHVALGAGSNAVPVAAEEKTTVNSNSTFNLQSIAQTTGDVRIVRTGSMFSLQYRAPGGSFQVLGTHDRPDLPATLQVGPMVYSNETAPDVLAHFDQVTIAYAEAIVTYPAATATDDTDPSPVVVCSPPSGSSFPAGDTMVTCTATDASGNSANCSFQVTVTEPVLSTAEPFAPHVVPAPSELFLRLFPYPAAGERPARPSTLDIRRR